MRKTLERKRAPGAGRPRKAEADKKGSAFTTRITAETRRALEVSARKHRRSLSQEAEAGLRDYVNSGWFTMLAPRGTPQPIIARLNQELNAALADPTVRERFTEQGAEPVIFTPGELAKFIASEIVKWRDIITKAGIPQIQ